MYIQYKDYGNCKLVFEEYTNDQIAIHLVGVEGEYNDSLILTATVAVNFPLDENEVIIKNYSENNGIYEVLKKEGIISTAKEVVRLGFTEGLVCDLLVQPDFE